ncbi:hypothetical protein C7477_103140 [Phyllobacterium leguminum]|uniref:Uncharacterized protein n=1 Tax=Phyllobacterium leguminum TaxID=314237 RepID=A0A318T4A0_9HYPH|nr:hypothetical protein C7477_103140 [Phyllobacterium leguminum]
MMWIAVVNNLPEMILGGAWTGLCLWFGGRIGLWKARRNAAKAEF